MSEFRFSPTASRAHEIQWHPWEPETFRLAQHTERPLLLCISAVWCHWCHVMDETTYSDSAVIIACNRHLIPVRVDRDRRPDIDGRYNMGGWPTTVFLSPAGRLITGGTYIPTEHMLRLIDEVLHIYQTQGERIGKGDRTFLRKQVQSGKGQSFPLLGQQTLNDDEQESLEDLADKMRQSLNDSYDQQQAGFGHPPRFAPKFPYPEILAALCGEQEKGNLQNRELEILTDTLDAMMEGEMHDQQRGGFFRYATRRDWRDPHYEKIASDNAQLAEVYLRAGRTMSVPVWCATAEGTVQYLIDTLRRSDGAFGGSQDAVEEFYRHPEPKREVPSVDSTIFVDVNARVASALLLAHRILGREEYRDLALQALDTTEKVCTGQDGLLHHFAAEDADRVPAFLQDYVELALAHLDAHAATGDRDYLERALSLADAVRDRFGVERGGFSDIPGDLSRYEGMLRRVRIPVAENARAALLCRKVGIIRNDPSWHQQGIGTLRQTARRALAAGPASGGWLAAFWEYRRPAPHIRLSLPDDHDYAMLQAAQQTRHRHVVIDVDDGHVRKPLAYLCRASSCLPPINDPDELVAAADSSGSEEDPNYLTENERGSVPNHK